MSCLAINKVLKALLRKFQQIAGGVFCRKLYERGGFNLAPLPMAGRQVQSKWCAEKRTRWVGCGMGDVFVVTTMWWWPCGGIEDELVVLATFFFSSTSLSPSQFIWWYQCGGMVDVYVAVLYEGGVGGGEQ